MIARLLILLAPLAPQYEARLSVEAAYILSLPEDAQSKCCGLCKGGKIIHGDGHVTDCPCPPTCKCKTAVTHPPVVIQECERCLPKP